MASHPLDRRGFLFGRTVSPAPIAIDDNCLARKGIYCASCRDACEPAAISFRPRSGGVPLPELNAAACTACGECLTICPAGAITSTVAAA